MAYEGYADTDLMALLLAWANNRIRGVRRRDTLGLALIEIPEVEVEVEWQAL
jgi:hypothetical protein